MVVCNCTVWISSHMTLPVWSLQTINWWIHFSFLNKLHTNTFTSFQNRLYIDCYIDCTAKCPLWRKGGQIHISRPVGFFQQQISFTCAYQIHEIQQELQRMINCRILDVMLIVELVKTFCFQQVLVQKKRATLTQSGVKRYPCVTCFLGICCNMFDDWTRI